MDTVVRGALAAPTEPGGAPDRRTLLIDHSVVEPMGQGAMEATPAPYQEAGATAAAGRAKKVARYQHLIADPSRQLLVPWVVETWGRHDPELTAFLAGTALVAAQQRAGRDSCGDDAADARRDRRVAAQILTGWRQRLSAGVVIATAGQLDRMFYPLAGSAARQGGLGRFVPRGGDGQQVVDSGLLGVTGRARNAEPRFCFSMI